MRIDNIHQALKQFHVQNPSSKETLLPATASQLSRPLAIPEPLLVKSFQN